jgi:hypothetical protein
MSLRTKQDHRTIALETVKQEVGNAEPLYGWAIKNVTQEFSIGPFRVKGVTKTYSIGPFRVGAVEDFRTYNDRSLGNCLRHACLIPGRTGTQTTRAWRTNLTRLGVIACPEVDWHGRYLILVIGYAGNPDAQVPKLPDHLWPAVTRALRNLGRNGNLGDILYGLSRQRRTNDDDRQ